MIGLVGLLPAILFVAFVATAFVEDADGIAEEPDPDAPPPGLPLEEMAGREEPPEPEDPPQDPGLPPTDPEPEPEPEDEPDPDPIPDTDPGETEPLLAPLAGAGGIPAPGGTDEADGEGEDALLTIDITNATIDTLTTDPGAPDDGFIAYLDSGATLAVNLGAEVGGSLLVLDIAEVRIGGGTDPDQSFLSRAIYILPEGVTPPEDMTATNEAELIASLGLIRLGEIDLGQLVTRTDPVDGEITVFEDTRQAVLPQVISNRAITTGLAVFA